VWFAYPVLLIVVGTWLLFEINSAPGDAPAAEVGFAIITWGLYHPVWFACMGLAFLFLAATNGAGGVPIELLAPALVFGLLGVAQLFAVRTVVGAIRNSRANTSREVDEF
jgi:hypothetical protein